MSYGSLNYSEDGKSAARYRYGITPMYKIDEATGLPEVLDEDAYFEVVRGRFPSSEYIYVRYMIRRRWWFDKKANEISELVWSSEISTKDILINALHLVQMREHDLKMKNDPVYRAKEDEKVAEKKKKKIKKKKREREDKLMGKYPPKKLGE